MKWISVKDQMPPDGTIIFFWYSFGEPEASVWIVGCWVAAIDKWLPLSDSKYSLERKITHWMAIPEVLCKGPQGD